MDAITKDLLDRRKKEIEWIQGTYKEAIAEAVNILNNELSRISRGYKKKLKRSRC